MLQKRAVFMESCLCHCLQSKAKFVFIFKKGFLFNKENVENGWLHIAAKIIFGIKRVKKFTF
jgi:hypothetical protein